MSFSEAAGIPDNFELPVASADSRRGTGDKRMLGSEDLTGGVVVVSDAPDAVDSGAGDEGWSWTSDKPPNWTVSMLTISHLQFAALKLTMPLTLCNVLFKGCSDT